MKTFLAILACIAGLPCAHGQQKNLDWLLGVWKLDGKNAYEVWTRGETGGNTLSGHSFHLMGNDTISDERISIRFFHGAYHYMPDIAGSQPAVDFAFTKIDEVGFVAENPQHDFPKIIRYKLRRDSSGDHLDAAIEGDGKIVPYHFTKLK